MTAEESITEPNIDVHLSEGAINVPLSLDQELTLDPKLTDKLASITKQDLIDILTSVSNSGEGFWPWVHDNQIFAAGLCAIAAAFVALGGSWLLARSPLKQDREKAQREVDNKKKVWEGKKRFLVFDTFNAATDASQYIHFLAGYIHNLDDDETPPEGHIFKKEPNFAEIEKHLDSVNLHTSSYPLNEDDLMYLSDDEMKVLHEIGFKVAYLKSRTKDVKEVCDSFLKDYALGEHPDETTNQVQAKQYKLVKEDVKTFAEEAKQLEDLALKFAKIFAPEIGNEMEAARNRAATQGGGDD